MLSHKDDGKTAMRRINGFAEPSLQNVTALYAAAGT